MKVIGLMAGVAALASALGPVLGGLMVDLGYLTSDRFRIRALMTRGGGRWPGWRCSPSCPSR